MQSLPLYVSLPRLDEHRRSITGVHLRVRRDRGRVKLMGKCLMRRMSPCSRGHSQIASARG
jgi:hypothetical protein